MNMCIHILHLEDNAYDTELVQATLQSAAMACQITRVQSREELIRALHQGWYDVILADYHLPDYDGMSALHLARERCPETPFIFVSGVLGEEAAIEALTQGATDYVLKHNLARLVPAVKRALDEAENRKERRRAEAALRKSEARYRHITETLTDYIYTVRVEGGHAVETRHGPGCLAVTGYSEEEFAADPYLWIRMVIDADRPVVQDQVRRVLAGEPASAIKHRIIRRDGALRWVCNTPVSRYDEQGILRSYDGLIQDITARKLAEELLQASETRYRSLFDDSPISLWEEDFTDVKNFLDTLRDSGISDVRTYFEQHPEVVQRCATMIKIVDVNRVTLAMFQCRDKAEFLTNLTQIFGHESYDVFREELVSLAEGKQVFEAEARHRTLHGDEVYVALKLTIIPGYEDTWSKVLVSLTDITERKRAEEELTRYREHLEDLVAERTEALEQEILERKHIEHALQKAKDVAEAANRAKSAFLANMSHELRTPLNAILGFAQLLWRDSQITQREALNIILHSGEHLLTLINDVLEIARIEAGRIELHPEVCDVGTLIHDVIDMMRNHADARQLSLTLTHTADIPRYIQTDTSKLRQILVNLIGNAIKFTETGGVTVRVRSHRLSDLASPVHQEEGTSSAEARTISLHVEIADTGIGIAAADQNLIFKPFEQIGMLNTTTGSGLGLTITRQYIELMGGTITVESPSPQAAGAHGGSGSVFRFELPVQPVSVEAITRERAEGEVVGLEPGQPVYRILIVEDQFENRLLLRKILEPVGFEVREAVNGAEAIQIFQAWQPQVIFMDWRMPGMDGLEATRRIKTLDHGSNSVIIMLTASAFKEQRDEALAAGSDDFLRKPFREAEIFEILRQHLGVRYVYAEECENSRPGRWKKWGMELTPEALAMLPPDLLSALEQAALQLDLEKMDQVIAAIRPEYHDVAERLAALVQDFRYQEIWTIIQHIRQQERPHE